MGFRNKKNDVFQMFIQRKRGRENVMKRSEQIHYLNEALLEEMPQYRREAGRLPQDAESQRYFLRCLMNIREPRALSPRFLQAQDELLQAEREEKGIVHVADLPAVPGDERIVLW